MKLESLLINGVTIRRIEKDGKELMCLTDMLKGFPESKTIETWFRSQSTIDYLSDYEEIYNPDFKRVQKHGVKIYNESERNTMSIGEWLKLSNAITLYVEKGKYGGTYGWVDICTKFAMYLSSKFEVKLVVEHRKMAEALSKNLFTSTRLMARQYYAHQTQAVQDYIIPNSNLPKSQEYKCYTREANLLNLAVYGMTAYDWKIKFPELAKGNKNQRDCGTAIDNLVIRDFEILNTAFIEEGRSYEDRLKYFKSKVNKEREKFSKLSESKIKQLVEAII